MAQARAVIMSGGVPEPDSITVEGMLSEHDVPLIAPESADEFYAYAGLAWRVPVGSTTGAAGADIILGIGTTIDLESIVREPQNLVVAVDRSDSMDESASPTDSRSKFEAVHSAIVSLLDRLDEGDRLSLVSFASRARVDVASVEVVNRDSLDDDVAELFSLKPDGATDLAAGLELAFAVAGDSSSPSRADRVILFTDAVPTDGDVEADDLVDRIRTQASSGIGFTLMGVGTSFGTDLALEMGQVAGANFYYLEDADRIERVFEDEFDFMVTPAAYDLILDISIPDGVGIRDVYGVPDYVPGAAGAQVVVPTLFFSRREGSGVVIVRLSLSSAPVEGVEHPLATVSMSYRLTDGTERSSAFDMALAPGMEPDGEPAYFSDESTRRTVVLLDTALVLHDAAEDALAGRGSEAISLIDSFLPRFDATILGLSDRTEPSSRGLSDERELLEVLRESIDNDLYRFN